MTLMGRGAKAVARCDIHPSALPHDHCPTCGEPRWEDSTHACPPGFAAAKPGPPSFHPGPGRDGSPPFAVAVCGDCGWRRTYRTEERATRALDEHRFTHDAAAALRGKP